MFSEKAKPKTPMYFLKNQLAIFKALPFADFVMLNRKGAGYSFVGSEVFEQKPITFDCIYLFNIKNSKASFSFSFNFFKGEQTVRATLRPNKFSGVEYTKEHSVSDMKSLINEFFKENKDDAEFLKDTEHFCKKFATHFGITLSKDVPPDEFKKLCGKFGSLFIEVNTQINRSETLMKKMEKTKGSKRFEDENYATLCQTRDDAYKTKSKLMSYDLLEAPQVVRKYVLKTFASK